MNKRATKYCSTCGSLIDAEAEICPKCGVRIPLPPTPLVAFKRKNPETAGVLSFLICGAGQIYQGQVLRGFGFMGGAIISGCIFGSAGLLIAIIIDLASIWDAYDQAKKYNMYYEQYGKFLW